VLDQQISTWGTCTPGDTQAVQRGYVSSSHSVPKFKKKLKRRLYVYVFDQRVRKRGPIFIWGFAEVYNFYLGVHKYQKVENPCARLCKDIILFYFSVLKKSLDVQMELVSQFLRDVMEPQIAVTILMKQIVK
jgi:hypothetical protein